MRCDSLWTGVHLATMADGVDEVRDGALAVVGDCIAWLGRSSEVPRDLVAARRFDGGGGWITPGLIDCHTHIVYAGNRSDEFEARLNGATYAEIAQRGGGIVSTVRATRAASEQNLFDAATRRVRALMTEGVTTIEIKSGYGLDLVSERKMLRVARRIGTELPVSVRTTFLGAHALPPEYSGSADDYIDMLCRELLPALAQEGLVDAVDAFCESIGFTAAQCERVFRAATALDIPVKLHAEQLSDQGGAALVARYRGLSADHLEWLSDDGIKEMARAGTVAVLLPGAFYTLRETRLPPIDALRAARVPMAVATDCNPGTSPLTSMLLAMNMACTFFRLTPTEALIGATAHGARALGLQREVGTLAVGMRADFVLWDIERPADLVYAVGLNPCRTVVRAGEVRQ